MPRFSQTLHLTRKPDLGVVCLSVATSENRVDEITVPDSEFRKVARALWDKSVSYEGGSSLRGKYTGDGFFSLSVETGAHSRAVYRLREHEVMSSLGPYMAETGGA